jgi:hypothetical protein
MKPGYRTSEFWFTLVSFLFSGLYLLGILNDHSQKEDLIAETSKGLEALILIIGQLTVLFRYIKGRNEIKKIWWNNQNQTESNKLIAPSVEVKKDVNQRTNNKRSRKTNTKNTRKSRRS